MSKYSLFLRIFTKIIRNIKCNLWGWMIFFAVFTQYGSLFAVIFAFKFLLTRCIFLIAQLWNRKKSLLQPSSRWACFAWAGLSRLASTTLPARTARLVSKVSQSRKCRPTRWHGPSFPRRWEMISRDSMNASVPPKPRSRRSSSRGCQRGRDQLGSPSSVWLDSAWIWG